jgi:phosphatidate cytidylyltransferase
MAILFAVRFLAVGFGIYLFDAFLLFIIGVSTFEIVHVRKLNFRGAAEYMAIIVFALLYFFYIVGAEFLTVPFVWWLHVAVSAVIIGIFTLFIYLSNLIDKAFIKRCNLAKLDVRREAALGAWDFIQMLAYPGLMLGSMIILNHMKDAGGLLGAFALLLIFAVSFATDTVAYCTGVTIGKGTKKMAPVLSPKKTWVGFVGGLFGGVLASLIVVWANSSKDSPVANLLCDALNGASGVEIVFICVGLVGAFVTTMGDLVASAVKRKGGVKDFAGYLPGHGGATDRLDGIIFNSVFIWIVMTIISLIYGAVS